MKKQPTKPEFEIAPSPAPRTDGMPSLPTELVASGRDTAPPDVMRPYAEPSPRMVRGGSKNRTEQFPPECRAANVPRLIPLNAWMTASDARLMLRLERAVIDWRNQIESKAAANVKQRAFAALEKAQKEIDAGLGAIVETAERAQTEMQTANFAVVALKDGLTKFAAAKIAPELHRIVSRLRAVICNRLQTAQAKQAEDAINFGAPPPWANTVVHNYETGSWVLALRLIDAHLENLSHGLTYGSASPKGNLAAYADWAAVEDPA